MTTFSKLIIIFKNSKLYTNVQQTLIFLEINKMLITWLIRIIILIVGFLIHPIVGIILILSLIAHMNYKANQYNRIYNMGGNIRGPNGKKIKAPWYLF